MNRSYLRTTGLTAFANAAALGLQFLTTILIARAFGAGAAMDAYTLAVSIPESLQYLLMLATLSVVFTPLFIEARARHGESAAWSMALSLLLLISAAVVIGVPLLGLALPWLMAVLAPGFAPETRALAVWLGDLILPGLLYYATAGVLLGICYAYHDFVTPAANSLLLAVLNLAVVVVWVLWLGGGVAGVMAGRLGALALMQLFIVWRVWQHKRGIQARVSLRDRRVWQLFGEMPPYMFGALSGQAELIVNRSLISTLGAGSVAAWGYGQRLADLPLAVLGAAFGATYLPEFAATVASGDRAMASAHWNRAMVNLAFVLAPVAALALALGAPLIALLFQRGAFDAAATSMSTQVLAGLMLGLPLRGIGGLIVRGMPAFRTRRLPLLLSALSSGTSIACAFLLLQPLGLFGVALAASLGDGLFAVIGALEFWRRLGTFHIASQAVELAKIGAASGGAALVSAWAASWSWSDRFALEPVWRLAQVTTASALGVAAFAVMCLILRVRNSSAIWELVARRARHL